MNDIRRVLLRHKRGERLDVDPLDVFMLEADEGETRVRRASRSEIIEVRELGKVAALFDPFGFVRGATGSSSSIRGKPGSSVPAAETGS